MAKYLVVVESPAKAKSINKYLGPSYKVEASMGHIRDLPKNKIGVDTDNGFKPEYVIPTAKRKVVEKIKKAAKGKEGIFLAADPDREGEAICYHLKVILENNGNLPDSIRRVTFNEITPNVVRESFKHSREIDINLFNAQQARRILDRLVGYSLSPLLWKKVAKGLSAGRVQSVALKLIVEREREIKDFKPKEYWSIKAKFSPEECSDYSECVFEAALDKVKGEKFEISNGEESKAIVDDLRTKEFIVSKIFDRQKKRKPYPPFITSKLQQEAFNKLNFPAQKTMSIAQRLYEGIDLGDKGTVGLITYMRTDSVNVSKSAIGEVRDFIKSEYGEEYMPSKPRVFKSSKRAQEAHEAIRPTSVSNTPDSVRSYLSDDEYKLYNLIWNRFVSSQMSDAVDKIKSIEINGGDYSFKTVITENIFKGFLSLYTPSEEGGRGENVLTADNIDLILKVGDKLDLRDVIPEQHFTKPPARYNDASLVKTLEELGIGRPSTYSPTIQTLLARGYVERKAKALHPTEIGETVVVLLVEHFSELLDVGFTASMENNLDLVEEGKKDWVDLLKEFYKDFSKKLSSAKENMKDVKKIVVETDYECDVCGRKMVIKWGRFGKFLACPGFPECKYTRPLPTGYRCPVEGCGGEIVKRQTRTRRTFYGCSNYPKCKFTANKLPQKKESD